MTVSTRRQARGFTVVELLVAIALLSVALLIANGLLLEAIRIFSSSGRELREPAPELALRLLREDLRASAPVLMPNQLDPLECRRPDRIERWRLVGERLERESFTLAGEALGKRILLDKMVSFDAQLLAPGLVQVTLVRRSPRPGSAMRSATSAWRSVGESLESATLVTGSRLPAW